MTIKDLEQYIQELKDKHGEDCHVFKSEFFISGNKVQNQISDFKKTDINFVKDVEMTAAFVYSQFNEGLVIGFVPTVE